MLPENAVAHHTPPLPSLFLVAAVTMVATGLAALAAGFAHLFRAEFMRIAAGVHRLATFVGDFTLLPFIHAGETASFVVLVTILVGHFHSPVCRCAQCAPTEANATTVPPLQCGLPRVSRHETREIPEVRASGLQLFPCPPSAGTSRTRADPCR
ncbi:exported hypothetical protein [uncultured Stenotrophomonas sp.]|uniref:Uncharacterized protein n=1 Tax=uncultured Stenotrophomonas sp. TaxID=165438 RepID=A0A1Y5Q8L5_9GAMM|nr:exported hypothetical protein [uncultured Stenotrophomonas sp.]